MGKYDRVAKAGDVVFVFECRCGPVLVASWAAEDWRCGSCGLSCDPGERVVLGPGGAVPDFIDREPETLRLYRSENFPLALLPNQS